jgi:hypothetical protein
MSPPLLVGATLGGPIGGFAEVVVAIMFNQFDGTDSLYVTGGLKHAKEKEKYL